MDEQKPTEEQDSNEQSSPVSNSMSSAPVINDIMPPPAPKPSEVQPAIAEPITVRVTDSSDVVEDDATVEPETNDMPIAIESEIQEEAVAPEMDEEGADSVDDSIALPPEEDEIGDETQLTSETAAEPAEMSQDTVAPMNVPEIRSQDAQTMSQEAPAAMAAVGVASSQMNKPPHRNNKKLAAIVTIVVAVILAGIAVFVYLSANKNATEDTADTNTTEQTTTATKKEVSPATTTDIEQTNTNVDEALKSIDDTADFAETDLSDTTLGL